MNDEITLELCESIASCSTRLGCIFYKSDPSYDIDKGLLENFGCVLGYICAKEGLSFDEAGSCIACIAGINGGRQEDFFHIAHACEFYVKQILKLEERGLNDIITTSSIYYNLANPKTWNDFSNQIPFQKINFLSFLDTWMQVFIFLNYDIPKNINPILEKF